MDGYEKNAEHSCHRETLPGLPVSGIIPAINYRIIAVIIVLWIYPERIGQEAQERGIH
jgi:hypothetical protein